MRGVFCMAQILLSDRAGSRPGGGYYGGCELDKSL